MLFKWRNDPFIIRSGISQKPVHWQEHSVWFQNSLKASSRRIFLIEMRKKPIGQVRFDACDTPSAKVSIYLLKPFIGKNLGVHALSQACQRLFAESDVDAIVAEIRSDNPRSLRAFQKVGFKQSPGKPHQESKDIIKVLLERPVQVPHNRLRFSLFDKQSVNHVMTSGHVAGGPYLSQMESTLAKTMGTQHAVGVGSGLAALRLTLKALDIRQGSEVLVPAYSCVALANAVLALGAVPVPVDIRRDDWNIDPDKAKKAITKKTSAVIAVNTFGAPASIEKFQTMGIPVIEDASHGFGVKMKGLILGGRGTASVVSFYATKFIGAGEGGAILTRQSDIAAKVASWRDYSNQPMDGGCLNDKMTDLEAALVSSQLKRLHDNIRSRQKVAQRYHLWLSAASHQSKQFKLPSFTSARVWYRYVIDLSTLPVVSIIQKLRRRGIIAANPITNWRPKGSQPCPIADYAYQHLLSLPCYPALTLNQQRLVCRSLSAVMKEYSHG